jgi:regulatory protein
VISAVTADPRDPSLAHIRVGRRSAAKIEYEGEWGAAAIGAVAGAVLDEHLIDAILRGQARTDARYWALRILSRSAVSRGGLIAKLQRKGRGRGSAREAAQGIDVGTATRIADELQAKGFLDDRRYAESVIAAELRRKPAGSRLLEMKLRAKRVEPGVAREVIAAAMGEQRARQRDRAEDPLGPALDLARRKLRTMGGRVEEQAAARRIYSLLARRGFDPDVCRGVTNRVVGDARNKS